MIRSLLFFTLFITSIKAVPDAYETKLKQASAALPQLQGNFVSFTQFEGLSEAGRASELAEFSAALKSVSDAKIQDERNMLFVCFAAVYLNINFDIKIFQNDTKFYEEKNNIKMKLKPILEGKDLLDRRYMNLRKLFNILQPIQISQEIRTGLAASTSLSASPSRN